MPIDTRSHPPAKDGEVQLGLAAADVLDCLGFGLLVVNPDGAIRYRNSVAAARLPDGRDLQTVFGPARVSEPFDGWLEEIARIVRTGVAVRFACVWPPAGEGPPPTATLRCSPLRTPSPTRGDAAPSHTPSLTTGDAAEGQADQTDVDGVVILIEDGAEQDLLEKRFDVTQRLASLGQLAARVAHELNNPLDGILRYINLAIRVAGDSSEPKLRTYLAESRTGLIRMLQIIGDLLEFSRTTNGEFDEANVNEVVEQSIKSTSSAADDNQVVVAADFHTQDMPAVRGSRLYQVCCNLMKNAIDAMPDGGRLVITTALVDDNVVIEVADTGVGLPAAVERLFEPFYTTKEPGKGTGLGLAICKDFIEDMKGTITAGPGEGGGAVFTVCIPVGSCHRPSRLAQPPPGMG